MIDNIGFIGLGAMGSSMFPHLTQAGYNVFGFDIKKQISPIERFSQVNNLKELKHCEAIIFLLPDGKIVRDVASNLLQLNIRTLFIDMSSSDPRDTQALALQVNKAGSILIDAPVSGGVSRARKAELTIMVGGNPKNIDLATPLLSTMGAIKIAGQLGAGHAMKALNNYVSAAGLIASFEALAAARVFGIKSDAFLNIINNATGRNNTTEVKLDKFIIPEKYNSGFSLALQTKDVAIANTLLQELVSDAPFSKSVHDYLVNSEASLKSSADHTEIYQLIRAKSLSKAK